MIILIWFDILMHFMYAVQMFFLLNVYMLIIKFTFYSLTILSSTIERFTTFKDILRV